MMDRESKPRYVISVTARIVGIEAHVLRYYEKLGLIQPERTEGRIRLYSEDDIARLRYIKTLICDCGVNPAGAEVALRLMQRMQEMQHQIEEMEKRIKEITGVGMEDVIEDIEWKEK
ncbi:MAG: MerR family transcriptional regulator [Chloroflexota bacterium]|nr:MerR family transcriptional regulator [Chloroflexota bacterium]